MEQKGIIAAIKSILKNKTMWKRLIISFIVTGLIAWLALVPKDVPTPWGTCHQGPVYAPQR